MPDTQIPPTDDVRDFEIRHAAMLATMPLGASLKLVFARLREGFGDDLFRETFFDTLTQKAGELPPIIQDGDRIEKVGPPPPMLIDHLIPEKSLVLLAGKAKQGKSFLGLDIADAVACKRLICGEYVVNRPGPVLYITMEDGEIEYVNRALKRGHKAINKTKPLFTVTERLVVSSAEGIAALRQMIKKGMPEPPVLVIIDTAREGMDIKDWNDSAQVSEKIRPIREFAREVCSVLLIAHNRKQAGVDDGDEIAGSGAFASSVDGWMSVQRSEKQDNGNRRMWLKVVGRGAMNSEVVVEMDTHTLHFRTVPDEEAAQGYRDDKDAQRQKRYQPVVAFVRGKPDGRATIPEISSAFGEGEQNTRRLVSEMERAGLLANTGEMQRGQGRPAPLFEVPGSTVSGGRDGENFLSFIHSPKGNERKKESIAAENVKNAAVSPRSHERVTEPESESEPGEKWNGLPTGARWSREPVGLAGAVQWVVKASGGLGFGVTQADAVAAFFDDLNAPTDRPDQVQEARHIAHKERARLDAEGEPPNPDAWLALHHASREGQTENPLEEAPE